MRRSRPVLSTLYSIYLGIARPVYTAGNAIISGITKRLQMLETKESNRDEFSGRTERSIKLFWIARRPSTRCQTLVLITTCTPEL